MKRYATAACGVVSYPLFLVAFAYSIGFVGAIGVPPDVGHGISAPIGQAVLVNIALFAVFGAQLSGMARPGFKRRWTRFVPAEIERSTDVLLASAPLLLRYWQWRTMPAIIWDVRPQPARLVLWTLFWLGWATVFVSSFMVIISTCGHCFSSAPALSACPPSAHARICRGVLGRTRDDYGASAVCDRSHRLHPDRPGRPTAAGA